MLSACSLECDSTRNELELAATLPHTKARIPPPHDTWIENRRLEEFIRDASKTGGISSVAAKYGMQCVPSKRDTACSDCLSCDKTVKEWVLVTTPPPIPISIEMWKCVDWGEVLVRVDAGPGSSIKAMTYWKTTPQARKAIAQGETRWD
jgi:hypothetical protein